MTQHLLFSWKISYKLIQHCLLYLAVNSARVDSPIGIGRKKLIIHTWFLFRVINISQGWIIWKCHWWSHLAVLTNIQKIFSGLHKVLVIKMWRKCHKIWWGRSCSPYTTIVSHWNVCRHGQCEQELCENAKRRNSASLNCLHMPRITSTFILLSELLFTLLTSSVHSLHKVA